MSCTARVIDARSNAVDDDRRQNVGLLVESLPPPRLCNHLDRHARIEHRRLDVQLHVRMAHDLTRSVPLDGLAGTGRRELAHVSIRNSLRRTRRYRR